MWVRGVRLGLIWVGRVYQDVVYGWDGESERGWGGLKRLNKKAGWGGGKGWVRNKEMSVKFEADEYMSGMNAIYVSTVHGIPDKLVIFSV